MVDGQVRGSLPGEPHDISDLPGRGRVSCTGFIESVTYPPASERARFSAIVVENIIHGAVPASPARMRVVWLGRRKVPGLEPGAKLHFEGMIMEHDGLPTMFNPRYEILTRQER